MNLSPQCFICSNYLFEYQCRAFPDRIPEEILTGEFDHTKAWPNDADPEDHGIRYDGPAEEDD